MAAKLALVANPRRARNRADDFRLACPDVGVIHHRLAHRPHHRHELAVCAGAALRIDGLPEAREDRNRLPRPRRALVLALLREQFDPVREVLADVGHVDPMLVVDARIVLRQLERQLVLEDAERGIVRQEHDAPPRLLHDPVFRDGDVVALDPVWRDLLVVLGEVCHFRIVAELALEDLARAGGIKDETPLNFGAVRREHRAVRVDEHDIRIRKRFDYEFHVPARIAHALGDEPAEAIGPLERILKDGRVDFALRVAPVFDLTDAPLDELGGLLARAVPDRRGTDAAFVLPDIIAGLVEVLPDLVRRERGPHRRLPIAEAGGVHRFPDLARHAEHVLRAFLAPLVPGARGVGAALAQFKDDVFVATGGREIASGRFVGLGFDGFAVEVGRHQCMRSVDCNSTRASAQSGV